MTALPPDQRKRLAKLCGMLGSDNPNERAAAADLATKLIREHGLTWEALIMGRPERGPPDFVEVRPHTWNGPSAPPSQRPTDVRDMIRACQEWSANLTGWENEFITNIAGWRTPLTDAQLRSLLRIYAKVSRWQSAWGAAS